MFLDSTSLPVPQFDDFEDDFSHAKVSVSNSHSCLLNLNIESDPSRSFNLVAPNGIHFDGMHPIYKTHTCILFVGRDEKNFYAIKSTTNRKLLRKEWELYNMIGDFQTIIKAHDFWMDEMRAYMQLEFAAGGAITNFVYYMEHEHAWKVLSHISYALYKIHSSGFVHLDISPSNILQSEDEIYKLTDFGTVIRNGEFKCFNEGAGPYVSPEALQYPNTPYQVSYPADIWSFGGVMFEILTHKRFPREMPGYDQIRNGMFDLSEIPEDFSFVKSMLANNPELRPTAFDLCQLPMVKEQIDKLESVDHFQPIHYDIFTINQTIDVQRRSSFDSI